ncbi:DNA repair and genetic recombination protein [Listeria floridensis FSL S10-1187]|uniref:DNA repair protein RecN n=1 Tax=Listeria floridensis FSL S10-1187 TaxID=1265817 RepID=A0ABN0RF63_9LIST|nr:DNA repair protein RecN [Listeria floridensis]EUJ31797.1 DNA repair and genetic recombination protein [Listeria floridensis FSL S10-1187]
MLQELTIHNFAIIESLSLSFEEGMTVLTGETGAGKSIIIDALGLLVGGRGSSQFIRHGEDKLSLEGLFELPKENKAVTAVLAENGIDFSDDSVVLERTVFKSGKNVCRVNGKLVTTTLLRDIGTKLLDIHTQHEHQELMHDEFHLTLLDRFAQKELAKPLLDYQTDFLAYQRASKELRNFTKNEREMAQRLDMLHFQEQEIREAGLSSGEEEALLQQKNRLVNFEKLSDSLGTAYNALTGDPGGLSYTGEAMRELEAARTVTEDYADLQESVASSYYQLEDAVLEIRQALDQLEFQPEELNDIENRLAELSQLKRKYGKTIEDIIQYQSEISTEIEQLENSERNVDALEQKVQSLQASLTKKAERLSKVRREAAEKLEKQIKQELQQLYMEKAIFEVHFETLNDFQENGTDDAVFYMSTNPGEPVKPISKVASGGELSRMMLALKTIFSRHQGITSIIFDEVDTGVSGRVAQAIAEKIYAVSIGSQVLCISHLPQVAAMADHHFYIAKQVQNKRTITLVKQLSGQDKVLEIGRMIAGTEVTKLAKEHAEEMIEQANAIKKTHK